MNKKNSIRIVLAAIVLGVSAWALSATGSGGTSARGVLQVQGYDHGTQPSVTTNPGDHPGGDTTSVGQATHGQYAVCKELASSGAYYDHGGHVKITMTGHADVNYDFTYGWLIKLPNTLDSYSWSLKITSNDSVGSYYESGKVYKCKATTTTTAGTTSSAPASTSTAPPVTTTGSTSSSAAPSTASASTAPAATAAPTTTAQSGPSASSSVTPSSSTEASSATTVAASTAPATTQAAAAIVLPPTR